MEPVTSIGGIFLRARDPERMSAWYRNHLGIGASDGNHRVYWSIFPADTDHSGPSLPGFMINYRVVNLVRMLDQLRQNGITVEKVENYDYGRFAWITDPEGNRIELWEPKNK
jgi:predicted enzyme related to lactoylglutathione lyase